MNGNALMYSSESELPLLARGKVRDIYDLDDTLLFVATDRISRFDVVLPTPIPGKGRVLTTLSQFWFNILGGVVPHHYLGTDISGHVRDANTLAELEGRSMIVRKAQPLPVEAIVRGYLSGSAWKEYSRTGTVSRPGHFRPGCGNPMHCPNRSSRHPPRRPRGCTTKTSPTKTPSIDRRERAQQIREYTLRIYQSRRNGRPNAASSWPTPSSSSA